MIPPQAAQFERLTLIAGSIGVTGVVTGGAAGVDGATLTVGGLTVAPEPWLAPVAAPLEAEFAIALAFTFDEPPDVAPEVAPCAAPVAAPLATD